jgi:pimeloyl-ACP methyl ester carboxylesterase
VTVVLLHAFPLDERMWEPQLAALGDQNVIVPNLYGFGGSSIDGWAGRALEGAEGELMLVGASLGGYVALAMARREPERIRGLLLAGSRATPDPPDRKALRDEMIRVVREEGIVGWNREFSPPGPPDRTIDELVRGIEALRDRPDSTDVVASFAGPLVVVVGEQDDILPVDEARQIAESAPNGRLEVVEGAGHLVSVDAPERFNQILLGLLRESAPGSARRSLPGR